MERSNRITKKMVGPYFSEFAIASPIEKISFRLDTLPRNHIDVSPWGSNTYQPDVQFAFAHGQQCIFIKYYVREAFVRATYFRSQDPVYKDSCVEFFVRFNDELSYYNFEFNALGTCLLYYGPDRHQRVPIPDREIATIRHYTTLQNIAVYGRNEFRWEMTVVIPLNVFINHKFIDLSGMRARANFHKCGDDLPAPHFLVWNDIQSEAPDFHRPECFGEIEFG